MHAIEIFRLAGAVVLFAAGAFLPALAADADTAALSPAEKAYYLTEKEQSFIRPGLEVRITSATVASDGTVSYTFTLKDPRGAPLDRLGVFTPGAIAVSSVIARVPRGERFYSSYTTRVQTSPITGVSETQAAADTGGTFESLGDGAYRYTFRTKLPAGADRSLTHTIAVWASRNLNEFDLGTNRAAHTYDFVPDGSSAPVVPLSVTDQKCDTCHGQVVAHGTRTKMAVCIVCHNPGTVDPDTGNSVDMATMTHKIHMGAQLPSVRAGTPYRIIGFQQRVYDYSDVVFPADARNCASCHVEDRGAVASLRVESSTAGRSRGQAHVEAARLSLDPAAQTGAPQANRHLLNPSRRACGACHDNVNFATGEGHANLPQVSDNQCGRCHNPQGELEFDLSILGAHTIERKSRELAGVNFEILNVTDGAPGKKPTVTFSLKNNKGEPIAPSSMTRLALVLAERDGGDFRRQFTEVASGAQGDNGVYHYTFQNATIPADASGTWAVGIEGYRNATLLAGTVRQRTLREAGANKVRYFDVGGGPARPRRTIVTQERCESCHAAGLDLHGSNRNGVEHCTLCHNPSTTDVARRPADRGPAESVNFKEMIHRIHAGPAQTRDYTIYGFGGTPHNYNHVRYPRPLAECAACHVAGTERLPIAADARATVDPRGFFDPAPPATGACLSCHTSISAAAHADLNTSSRLGESCDVCHGPGAQFAVDRVHAQ